MSSTQTGNSAIAEHCEHCNRETQRTVQIQLRTESKKDNANAVYSREPYRVSECLGCGTSTSVRMNNA